MLYNLVLYAVPIRLRLREDIGKRLHIRLMIILDHLRVVEQYADDRYCDCDGG